MVTEMKNTSNAATAARKQRSDDQSTTGQHALQRNASEPESIADFSEQGYPELLPKLMQYFNNDREELACALGLNRSTVDRWFNGKSRPNNSTVLRMRNLARERLTAT